MSHDVKKNKFLKKILGSLVLKFFLKKLLKTERFLKNSGDFIKLLISKKNK